MCFGYVNIKVSSAKDLERYKIYLLRSKLYTFFFLIIERLCSYKMCLRILKQNK